MSIASNKIVASQSSTGIEHVRPPQTLLATPVVSRQKLALPDDMAFFEEAVGPLMAGVRYLCAGSPGGGKSRLATQLALAVARTGQHSLTLMTEEGPDQLRRRTQQMTCDWPAGDARRAMAAMHVETLPDIAQSPDFLIRHVLPARGAYHGVKFIVLDSIQGHGLAASATKTYGKVLEFARLCEENDVAVLMVSHVTKKGDIAGPKALEHSVDVSLVLRRAMKYSLLGVRKNRFGAPLLKPLPLRINPVTTRVEPAPHCEPRPAMARTYAGAGTGLLEIQSAVAIPSDGTKGRMLAPGLPRREIEQLISTMAQIPDLDLGDLDFTVHCRMPGKATYQPNFGLPLCMALLASYLRRAVPENHLYLGEIDLFRSVRPIPRDLLQSLRSALDSSEIPLPVTLFVPTSAISEFTASKQVKVVGCRSLEDALLHTWPDLR